jgi:small subunit ribosomal protein S1
MENQKFIPEGWDNTQVNYTCKDVENAMSQGAILQGLVTKCDDSYNLHVDLLEGYNAVIPFNEVDALNCDENGQVKPQICKYKINNYVQFKVKDIKDNNITLSRKDVQIDASNWLKQEFKPGMKVKGIVKNIRKFGAFIEIGGGVVGLLHIEDISVSRIKTPEERFQVGDKIDVIIKDIEEGTGKVILSYKELLGNWEDNVKDFKEKQVVDGIIKESDKFKNGIFVELKPNLVGLAEYKEGYNYGEKVKVFIKKIINDRKKIKLIIL